MNNSTCLVILAGGQSKRMGQDKAIVQFRGQRLVDRAVERLNGTASHILLSAPDDFGTGFSRVADDANAPDGPVGAIFSVAAMLCQIHPDATGFATIPIDAPFASPEIVRALIKNGGNCVAENAQRLHPTFAHWQIQDIRAIYEAHEPDDNAPSLHWLVRKSRAATLPWPNERDFINVNNPEDLAAAEALR